VKIDGIAKRRKINEIFWGFEEQMQRVQRLQKWG
jgi:hypothetical protein